MCGFIHLSHSVVYTELKCLTDLVRVKLCKRESRLHFHVKLCGVNILSKYTIVRPLPLNSANINAADILRGRYYTWYFRTT